MTPPHVAPAAPDAGHEGTTPALTPLDALHRHLDVHLDPAARDWFGQALAEAAAHPGTHGPISVWELRLAEAGRRCGARYADAARVLILRAARADPDSWPASTPRAPPTSVARSCTPCPTSCPDPMPSRWWRTRCAPTTRGSWPPPSAPTPPATSTPTPGATPS